jgi:hypothetical protein
MTMGRSPSQRRGKETMYHQGSGQAHFLTGWFELTKMWWYKKGIKGEVEKEGDAMWLM